MNDVSAESMAVLGAAAPRARGGLPLQGVSAKGRLDGLLFELSVEQRYRNESDRVIEAVFTFPVPVRAVLLGLELGLGERKLEAVAIAKAAATEKYERAIDDGDAAVLLESVGNGLYTVSVGNLKPGESAVIRYRHAELLDANRGTLRLQVPTVIAPRYGNPRKAGLEGPAVPETDLVAEYPFDIEILLAGIQADASALESPTHSIRTQQSEAGTVVTLAKAAALDRDFVLEVPQAYVPKDVLVAKDGDEWVVIASAVLEGLPASERRALALTVVLDCSGSMAGDSIEAAKRAVGRVLESLDVEDRIGLLRFGSSHQWDTEGMVGATWENLAALRAALRNVGADLGGTEMGSALEAAVSVPAPAGVQPDLLMITDGQVHELDALVDGVARAGRRLFVVSVGSAPNEALARRLSEATGGACEFVGSGELAEDAIVRMFRRMRALPRRVGKVQWPEAVAWQLAAPRAVFPDETVHLVAGLKSMPVGRVRIAVGSAADAGGVRVIEVPVLATDIAPEVASTIVRVAGARRVAVLAEQGETEAAAALAERLQIASAFTSFVVVAERSAEEKAQGLPATVAVPQMLAAGFGGAASAEPLLMACRDTVTPFGAALETVRFARRAGPLVRAFRPQGDNLSGPPSWAADAVNVPAALDRDTERQDSAVDRAIRRLTELWIDQDYVTTDEIRVAVGAEGLEGEDVATVVREVLALGCPVFLSEGIASSDEFDVANAIELDDTAEILQRVMAPIGPLASPETEFPAIVAALLQSARSGGLFPDSWERLRAFGVPERVLRELARIASEQRAAESTVVVTFVALLFTHASIGSRAAQDVERGWHLAGSIWTRGAQRKLRAVIRERVFES